MLRDAARPVLASRERADIRDDQPARLFRPAMPDEIRLVRRNPGWKILWRLVKKCRRAAGIDRNRFGGRAR